VTSTAPLDERSLALRRRIVDALEGGKRGHVGASLSLVEILRVLYDDVLTLRPNEPRWVERDHCILSKGHGCLTQYTMLAERGFFSHDELLLQCTPGALLGGHPDTHVPGVEAATGALGHGLAIGVGLALAARMQKRRSRTFVVMGDGEINEGSVWEAALSASKHHLSSLTAIIDYNKLQSYGKVSDVLPLEPLADKWRAFGFAVREVDGHDVEALRAVFKTTPFEPDRPSLLIAHTIKGRGIPFAEGQASWHHKASVDAKTVAELRAALAEVAHA
jgi:transketolase